MQFNYNFTMLSEVFIMCEFVIQFFVYLNNFALDSEVYNLILEALVHCRMTQKRFRYKK